MNDDYVEIENKNLYHSVMPEACLVAKNIVAGKLKKASSKTSIFEPKF